MSTRWSDINIIIHISYVTALHCSFNFIQCVSQISFSISIQSQTQSESDKNTRRTNRREICLIILTSSVAICPSWYKHDVLCKNELNTARIREICLTVRLQFIVVDCAILLRTELIYFAIEYLVACIAQSYAQHKIYIFNVLSMSARRSSGVRYDIRSGDVMPWVAERVRSLSNTRVRALSPAGTATIKYLCGLGYCSLPIACTNV